MKRMSCARCGKGLDNPAAWVGGNPVGPKCWQKMGGDKPLKIPRVYRVMTSLLDENQKDLFDDSDVCLPTE